MTSGGLDLGARLRELAALARWIVGSWFRSPSAEAAWQQRSR